MKPLPSQRQEQNRALAREIQQVDREHRGRYGSPLMTRELRRRGHRCGENRVARLMRQRGIAGRRKRGFRPRTTDKGPVVAPNRLAQQPPAPEPNRAWVSDITYIATLEGWLYLFAIVDLFSRRVVGWALEESLAAAGVVRALRSALYQREPPAGLYFHSDRGSQYSSARVRAALGSIGAVQSMSGAGHCYDNAVCEAFFSSFKTECLPPEGVFASWAEARRQVFEYLAAYYNTRRLHSSLGYRTPCQFEPIGGRDALKSHWTGPMVLLRRRRIERRWEATQERRRRLAYGGRRRTVALRQPPLPGTTRPPEQVQSA